MIKNKKTIIIGLAVFALFAVFVFPALAQYQLETKLPKITGQPDPGSGLVEYINYIFIFGLGLITVLALGQMMFGGIKYILAAGNASKVEDAKDYIKSALWGLGILLASYLLLNTINPDLVNINNPTLTPRTFESTAGIDAKKEVYGPGYDYVGKKCLSNDPPPATDLECNEGSWFQKNPAPSGNN